MRIWRTINWYKVAVFLDSGGLSVFKKTHKHKWDGRVNTYNLEASELLCKCDEVINDDGE